MVTTSSLSAAIEAIKQRLDDGADAALKEVGEAWAAEASPLAPRRTGRLQGSLEYRPTGHLTGEIRMVWYGDIVRHGLPAGEVVRTIKATPARGARATRTVTYQRPARAGNDFMARAWETERVQTTLARFPAYCFEWTR